MAKWEFSKNPAAERLVGLRRQGGIAIDEPCELGYRCPVCKNEPGPDAEGNYDERLCWSEYNSFLWCEVCNRDYPSCLCAPDPVRATEIFLLSVSDARALVDAANAEPKRPTRPVALMLLGLNPAYAVNNYIAGLCRRLRHG